jgi:hypothetical protein
MAARARRSRVRSPMSPPFPMPARMPRRLVFRAAVQLLARPCGPSAVAWRARSRGAPSVRWTQAGARVDYKGAVPSPRRAGPPLNGTEPTPPRHQGRAAPILWSAAELPPQPLSCPPSSPSLPCLHTRTAQRPSAQPAPPLSPEQPLQQRSPPGAAEHPYRPPLLLQPSHKSVAGEVLNLFPTSPHQPRPPPRRILALTAGRPSQGPHCKTKILFEGLPAIGNSNSKVHLAVSCKLRRKS